MELTWGFLVFMVVFLIPGFIIRRLYFHNDFSKQYRYSEPLLKTIFFSLIPGFINAIVALVLFDWTFTQVDLGRVIDTYNSFSSKDFHFQESSSPPIKKILYHEVLPFLGFLWVSALISGLLSGRIVHQLGLDSKWHILRYKNPWFYLFNGHRVGGKNLKFLKRASGSSINHEGKYYNFLFTSVDVLVNNGGKTQLYSGILVDYEMQTSNNQELSYLVLRNANKYLPKDGQERREAHKIPGDLFVVHCNEMCNLNIRYVFEESTSLKGVKSGRNIFYIYVVAAILIVPFFVFRIEGINYGWYEAYFRMSILGQIFAYFSFVQVLSIAVPFIEDKTHKVIRWISFKEWGVKWLSAVLIVLLTLLLEILGKWILGVFN